MRVIRTKANNATNNFKSLVRASLGIAVLAFAIPFVAAPGGMDTAIKLSALLSLMWGVLVLFAFAKFNGFCSVRLSWATGFSYCF